MTPGTLELRDVAKRLERLEKQNRKLKYAGAAALVLVSAVLLMGQAAPVPETIEARQFIVRDADGKARAVLGVTEAGGSLGLCDADGNARALLGVTETGPTLWLHDADGTTRALLVAAEAGAVLGLHDPNGTLRAVLTIVKEGPGLLLYDADGKPLFSAP